MVRSTTSRPRTLAVCAALLLLPQVASGSGGPASEPRTLTADMAITAIVASPSSTVPDGTNLTYTISYINHGPDTPGSTSVRLEVPANTTFVSSQVLGGTDWNVIGQPPVGGTGSMIWRKGQPGPGAATGETAQFEFVVAVAAGLPNGLAITGTASAYSIDSNTTDPVPANDAMAATVNVTSSVQALLADMAITAIVASPSPTVPDGTNLTFTISYINNGPDTPGSTSVMIDVPANTTFVSSQVLGGTDWHAIYLPPAGGTGTMVWRKGQPGPGAASGETAQFQFVVAVPAGLVNGLAITGMANAYSIDGGTFDPVPTNNSRSATVNVASSVQARSADMAITAIVASPSPTVPDGTNLTLTISYINNGPDTPGSTSVNISMPAHTTFVSSQVLSGTDWYKFGGGPPVGGTGSLIWRKGNPGPGAAGGETAQFELVVAVEAGLPNNRTITTTANAYSADPGTTDPVAGNNSMSLNTTVASNIPSRNADLAITGLTALPTPDAMVGGNITYTIGFVNNGPDTATSASVRDTVPANTTFVSMRMVSGTGWNLISTPLVGGTGNAIFRKGYPDPGTGPASGETAQFEVVLKVNPGTAPGTVVTNTVTTYSIDSATVDPVGTNNASTVTTNAVVVADPLEPNDTPATASVLPLGTTPGLIYRAPADADWFKFFVPPEDAGKDLKVNVRITSTYPDPPPANWRSDVDWELLDESLNTRAAAISASDNETLYLHGVASGWYYAFVGYSTTDYADNEGCARYAITIETGTNFGVGYINGRVVDGEGQGIGGVYVGAQVYPRDWNISFVTGTTNADGTFSVATNPGTFVLSFTGRDVMTSNTTVVNVVDEWYADRPSLAAADHFSVAGGQTFDAGDVTMEYGAIVSGQVRNQSAAPLANVSVAAYDTAGNQSNSTYTDTNGNYTLSCVPVGGAKVRFSRGGYALEFYDDQPAFGPGGILATVSGETIGNVDAVLTAGGSITGATQNTSGAPIGVNVRLYSVLDSTFARATLTSNASTGAFTFSNVKPGQYKIRFSIDSIGFAEEWYNAAADFASAQVITVNEGGTVSGITAQLVPTAPEVGMSQGGTPLASGGNYAYGSRMVNSDTDVVFSITNTGTGGLTFTTLPFIVTGPDASQFPVAVQPAVPVPPGATSTITIRFRPTSAGPKTAYLSFGNNDVDENPYVVNLTGTGLTEPMVPVITWPDPAPILPGTPLTILQLNATANVPGTFVYTPDFGAVLPVGTRPLSVHFTPDDTVNYTTADASVSITVGPIVGGAVYSDFTGDLKSDILWRHATGGDVWLWPMDGAAKVSETYVRTVADTNWEIRGQGDMNGDGKADLLWRHKVSGMLYYWPMDGPTPLAETYVGTVDPAFDIVGTGDFNGDGKSDILWRHLVNGELWVWLMDGPATLGVHYVDTVDPSYVVKGVGDLDADLKADLVWHGAAGDVWVWLMNGPARLSQTYVGTVADTNYQIQQVADFDGNGTADLLWWNAVQGDAWIWPMDGATVLSETYVGAVPDTQYRIQAAGDYNGDRSADLLWRHAAQGDVWVWLMNGLVKLSENHVGTVPDTGYQIIK